MIRGLRATARTPDLRGLVGEQVLVTGAQLVSGVGNLLFVVLAARILPPAGFARLAAFLALYLVVHMPTGSLSAASTLAPARAPGLRRRLLFPVFVVAAAVTAAAPLGAPLLGLPPGMVMLIGATVMVAPFLALERGPLHGFSMNGQVSATLVVEPLVRLVIGLPLAVWLGDVGGALGVVLAGYAALAVAAFRRSGDPRGRWLSTGAERPDEGTGFWWTAAAFLMLALFQKQDVVFANRFLPAQEAAVFAVVATLGGAAVLASIRVPLVLIPRAVRGSTRALGVALGLAAGLGLGAVAVVALAPEFIVSTIFGMRYEGAGRIVVPYTAAMAGLAVTRVLAAYHCAAGRPRAVAALVASVVALHIVMLIALGSDAGGVVMATLAANVVLIVLAGARALFRVGIVRRSVRT